MSKILNMYSLIIILQIFLSLSAVCKEGSNNCARCNPVTKLCIKCNKDIYSLNRNGECEPSKDCRLGKNYCLDCNEEGNLCQECDVGFYPDENGGCSYSDNCQLSDKGKCLKCKKNYVLNSENSICKSILSEDYKNCKTIKNGICQECNEGYFLNGNDKRCSTTENCSESAFASCQKCNLGFYLDIKDDNRCKRQKNELNHCQLSISGKSCDICDDDYFFDEEGICVNTDFCSESDGKGKCKICIQGYYLSSSNNMCTKEKRCVQGMGDTGICLSCPPKYVIDLSDGKCKSNEMDNDLKYCESADGFCNKCINGFELGKDNRCSTSANCGESENGLCISCIDNYYLGLDFKCTNVKHCLRSYEYECLECEENYYYNRDNKTCFEAKGKYENCQYGVKDFCLRCNDEYYLNRSDHLCYSNLKKNNFYKCAMTDFYGEYCFVCEEDYYLGIKDNKCSKAENCYITEDENRCQECRDNYCLNQKTGLCVFNQEKDEDNLFYYKCKQTNDKGTECEICEENYSLDKNGLCVLK